MGLLYLCINLTEHHTHYLIYNFDKYCFEHQNLLHLMPCFQTHCQFNQNFYSSSFYHPYYRLSHFRYNHQTYCLILLIQQKTYSCLNENSYLILKIYQVNFLFLSFIYQPSNHYYIFGPLLRQNLSYFISSLSNHCHHFL